MVAAVVEFLKRFDGLVRRGDGANIETIELAGELAAGIVLVDCHLGAGDAGIKRLDVHARCGPGMIADLADVADHQSGARVRRLRNLDREASFGTLGVSRGRFCGRRGCGRCGALCWRLVRGLGDRDCKQDSGNQ
jgi:hypothetical protein